MTKRDEIAQMMDELGCTGRRVTKEQIEARIEEVDYQTVVIAGQKMMFCGIRMAGDFVSVGKPAIGIDPSNWREEICKKISYENSFDDLYKLEAYHMTYEVGGNHVNRAFHELQELTARYDKLCKFLESDHGLDADTTSDLVEQRDAMLNYAKILGKRLQNM